MKKAYFLKYGFGDISTPPLNSKILGIDSDGLLKTMDSNRLIEPVGQIDNSFETDISFGVTGETLKLFNDDLQITGIVASSNIVGLSYSINSGDLTEVNFPFSGTLSLSTNDEVLWSASYSTEGVLSASVNLKGTKI